MQQLNIVLNASVTHGKALTALGFPLQVANLEFLTKLYNRTVESERMPDEWRDIILIPIFKNKGDVQNCSNYRGIKLVSHTMKLWERVVERRLRSELTFSEQQYGFMPGKNHYRFIGCFESVDGEVQRRSEGATLCVCGPGERA